MACGGLRMWARRRSSSTEMRCSASPPPSSLGAGPSLSPSPSLRHGHSPLLLYHTRFSRTMSDRPLLGAPISAAIQYSFSHTVLLPWSVLLHATAANRLPPTHSTTIWWCTQTAHRVLRASFSPSSLPSPLSQAARCYLSSAVFGSRLTRSDGCEEREWCRSSEFELNPQSRSLRIKTQGFVFGAVSWGE